MKPEILNLGRHSLVYGLGIVISKLASFIMLPVYTQYLTPADYGTAELLTTTIDVIGMIAGMGLTATIFKYYSEYEKPNEKNEVISTALTMMLVISLTTSTVGILLSRDISIWIFGDANYNYYLRLAFALYAIQQGAVVVPLMFIQAQHNSKLFLLISITKLFIQVSLNLYFLVFLNKGLVSIFYSSLLAEMVIGLYLSFYVFRIVKFRFSRSKAARMVRFGYPFVFAFLSSFVLHYSDRYFLNSYSDLTTVGIYALAYKFGFLLSAIAIAPFSQVWEPRRFEIIKQEDGALIFRKVFFYLNVTMISLALVLALFTEDILILMADPAYHPAHRIVPIVMLAFILQTWGSFCNIGAYLKNRSSYLSVSSFAAAVANVLLNFLLIPSLGAHGAAWATVGGFFSRFVILYFLSQKLFYIYYDWSRIIWLLGVSVVFYFFGILTLFLPSIFSIAIKIGIVLVFMAVIYIFFLEKQEKEGIKRLMQKPFPKSAFSV